MVHALLVATYYIMIAKYVYTSFANNITIKSILGIVIPL